MTDAFFTGRPGIHILSQFFPVKNVSKAPILVLASASPGRNVAQRRDCLHGAFNKHYRVATAGREPARLHGTPGAREGPGSDPSAGRTPVLGADTIVVVEGEILGKPRDEGDARRMLHLLSGRTHQVTTGVCLAGLRTEGTKNWKPGLKTHVPKPRW